MYVLSLMPFYKKQYQNVVITELFKTVIALRCPLNTENITHIKSTTYVSKVGL